MSDAPLTNRIELTGDPSSGALRIDGHLLPFSAAVLRLEAPKPPVLSVALPVIGGAVVTLDAKTGFDEKTAAALVAMGWTPPAEPGGHWQNVADCNLLGEQTHMAAGIRFRHHAHWVPPEPEA